MEFVTLDEVLFSKLRERGLLTIVKGKLVLFLGYIPRKGNDRLTLLLMKVKLTEFVLENTITCFLIVADLCPELILKEEKETGSIPSQQEFLVFLFAFFITLSKSYT